VAVPRGAAAWKPWTAGAAFVGGVGLVLAGRAVVATGSGGSTGALLGVGIALILLSVATVGMVLLLANMHSRPTADDFGLRRPPITRATGLTVAVWIALTALTVLWVVAVPLAVALHWTWQTPVLMVGSTVAALVIARLIAIRLGDRPVQTRAPPGGRHPDRIRYGPRPWRRVASRSQPTRPRSCSPRPVAR